MGSDSTRRNPSHPRRRGLRSLCVTVCYVLFFALASVSVHAGSASARVLVVGIDGASWNVLDPMIEAGELPNLASLIERGGSAYLDTVEPVTSPVVWTSIATGRSPEIHGVSDFFSTRATIAVPTIYERLAAEGKRVGLYEVLMSWPPPALPGGFVVPAWLRRDDTTWPPDALEGLPIFRTVYDTRPRNRDYFEQALEEVTSKANSWKALAERFDPEVGALTYFAVDATSHRYWHSSFPEDFEGDIPEFAPDERHAIQNAVRGVDRDLGQIVADLDLEGADSVIVVSDHGFHADPDSRNIWNARFEDLLAKHDLASGRDGFTLVSTFFAVTLRIAPGPFEERDRLIEKLSGLLDSYRDPDGNLLMRTNVLDVAPRPAGMERTLTNRVWQWGVRKLMSFAFSTKIDPTAHAVIIGLPRGGDLLAFWPDGEIQVDGETMPLHQAIVRQRFTGTHDPTAIFIAAGAGIEKQPDRARLSVLDVAPLVAYLAGSTIPDDLEGRFPVEWVKASMVSANPPEVVPAEGLPVVPRLSDPGDSGAEDPALIEKLRALGYIE